MDASKHVYKKRGQIHQIKNKKRGQIFTLIICDSNLFNSSIHFQLVSVAILLRKAVFEDSNLVTKNLLFVIVS